MKIGIVSDTSADFTREEAEEKGIVYVPFNIYANDHTYVDDDDLDLKALYADMKATKEPIRTGCPSPFQYKEAILKADAEAVFVVTISSKLSGSHNAAMSAMQEVLAEDPEKKIVVVDSKSASAGVTNVVDKLSGWIREGKSFETIERDIAHYVEHQVTFFILETMENLMKNGRIPRLAGKAVDVLNVKPIMKGEDGAITLHQINRGFKKSLKKLADELAHVQKERGSELITISHSCAEDKARMLENHIREKLKDVRIRVVQTKGLASVYADAGGIVVAL
ncbi:MAG: DegV family protein [Peptoniphilus sp.]|nr:DegV family protein [Peptoniphilus sp.]MDY6044436.1 DegV family protein [Peptoniphilus sp.]